MLYEEKSWHILSSVGDMVSARFRVKEDAWNKIEILLRYSQVNYKVGNIATYRGSVYHTFVIMTTWKNYYKIRLEVNRVQQERLKNLESVLAKKAYAI